MIQQDTVRLLRECSAGADMGISSINDVYGSVEGDAFRRQLADCRSEHEKLRNEINEMLDAYHDEGKEPTPMAKGMSWIKTNIRLAADRSDRTIADLMTDGCNMGVKSLSKYLNQYQAADERSKDAAKKLIKLEEDLASDIRCYL